MAKKDFSQKVNPVLNPALKFFSPAAQAAPAPQANTAPQGSGAIPKPTAQIPRETPRAERKTKRLNLLLQPSILEELSKIAYMKQSSVNDLINTVLKEYVEGHGELSAQYRDIFGGKEDS